jgi:hypothetical protein
MPRFKFACKVFAALAGIRNSKTATKYTREPELFFSERFADGNTGKRGEELGARWMLCWPGIEKTSEIVGQRRE